jgi:hypothetical protein
MYISGKPALSDAVESAEDVLITIYDQTPQFTIGMPFCSTGSRIFMFDPSSERPAEYFDNFYFDNLHLFYLYSASPHPGWGEQSCNHRPRSYRPSHSHCRGDMAVEETPESNSRLLSSGTRRWECDVGAWSILAELCGRASPTFFTLDCGLYWLLCCHLQFQDASAERYI